MSRVMKSSIAAAIIASALFVPMAQAQPMHHPTQGQVPAAESAQVQHGLTSTFAADASSTPVANVATSSGNPDDFNWGDAGIGAGAMLLLIGLGTTGVLAVSRKATRRRLA